MPPLHTQNINHEIHIYETLQSGQGSHHGPLPYDNNG